MLRLLLSLSLSGLLFCSITHADEIVEKPATATGPAVVAPVEPNVDVQLAPLHPLALHGTLTLGYIAPIKYGFGLSYAKTENWVWDLSYIKGGVGFGVAGLDFGGFDESLVAVNGRYYPWSGSFNWIVGLSRHAYRVTLGNEMVARMTGGPGSTDLLRVSTLGLQLGLGNRIRFKNQLWLSIDWLTINIPLSTLNAEGPAYEVMTSANDRRLVGDALKLMENLPTATFLRTSLGYSF